MIRGRLEHSATWGVAGGAAIAITGIAVLVAALGVGSFGAFWPRPIVEIERADAPPLLGERIAGGDALLVRTSESDRIGSGYRRVPAGEIVRVTTPADAYVDTLADGRRIFGRGDAAAARAALAEVAAPAELGRTIWPNALGLAGRAEVFAGNVIRFLGTSSSASTLAGGALAALVGTLVLVMLMSAIVLPLGVAAAVYLHERRGFAAASVRAAIANLAGVPSIVYGVLGLGLFVHGIGAGIDRAFYAERLPVPTFGSGGLLWAALTLAVLTLPVVVVSVEEGLARTSASFGLGSLALGATRGETMWRLLLPAARPALLTGLILAIARAAGAVAPLMLVGVVKLAPALPVDGTFPFLHPSRQFMHLGFEIYDAALASPDSLRGIPRAYACGLLLVVVVVALNLTAIVLRNRLRARYRA